MKKQTFSLIAFLLITALGVWAQPPIGRGLHRGPRGPVPEEVKAYLQEQVLPVVEAQRAKLDIELSDQELAEVEDIRLGLQALKEEREALRESFKALRESHEGEGRPDIPDELRETMKELGKSHRKLMTRAWAIVDANEAEVEALLEELEPQAEQWREDIHALVKANKPEGERTGRGRNRGEIGERRPQRPGRGGRGTFGGQRGPGMGGPGGLMGKWHHPVAFLLFDASLMEAEMEGTGFNVFPNPSSSQSTLEYSIEQSGEVKIDLLDKNGNTLRRLLSTPKEAGSYSLSVDLTDLGPGVYFYQIQTKSGVKTQKILVD